MGWLDTPSTVFEGDTRIAAGRLGEVALSAKQAHDRNAHSSTPLAVLVFDDRSSETIELDWRGSAQVFSTRLQQHAQVLDAAQPVDAPVEATIAEPAAPRGPGRPKLGVVAREVTLLPRHWEWLATQSGGASVALRKLVEAARRGSDVRDLARQRNEVAYKFMATMAGHQPGFEEASRALFASDISALGDITAYWPTDVRAHVLQLADAVLDLLLQRAA